ncbi:MAG: ATP-binding protein [Clostridia bacterium]|nr:ATP-binding protein [Clostridia bacterium]
MFDDRIEFVSIGGLIKGISINDIMFGISLSRNVKLANVFYRLKLIETYGTGMQKIMESYSNYSKKPKVDVSDNAFRIVLPNTNIISKGENLSRNEQAILELLENKDSIARKDVEILLSVSQTMAGRVIRNMVKKGIIVLTGNGMNTKYV